MDFHVRQYYNFKNYMVCIYSRAKGGVFKMKKMQTLFEQDEKYKVLPKLRLDIKNYTMSVKKDGTSCMIKDNQLYKRYDANQIKGRQLPKEYIACQDKPNYNGSFPVWIKVDETDHYHHEAFNRIDNWEDGTYELCGPKVNGNREGLFAHCLLKHGDETILGLSLDYDDIKNYLEKNNIEGIVIKDEDTGIMYKIRKIDFGMKWNGK